MLIVRPRVQMGLTRARLGALGLVVLSVTQCARPTELWVVVVTDIPPMSVDPDQGVESVQIRAFRQGESTPFYDNVFRNFVNAPTMAMSSAIGFPGYLGVRSEGMGGVQTMRVELVGTLVGGETLRNEATASFGVGRRLRLEMGLYNRCRGDAQMQCAAMRQTCGRTGCEPIEHPVGTLEDFTGETPAMPAIAACTAPAVLSTTDAMLTAPRLIAPLSGSVMATKRPLFRWQNAPGVTGARVEICADSACTMITSVVDTVGSEGPAACDLAPGAHFFRARAMQGAAFGAGTSATWFVRIPAQIARRREVTTSATGLDVDLTGDGLADTLTLIETSWYIVRGVRGGVPTLDATPWVAMTMASGARFMGDLNGDGITDVLLGNQLAMSQRGMPPMLVAAGFAGTSAAAGDVNGDGYGDIVTGDSTANGNIGAASIRFGNSGTNSALMLSGLPTRANAGNSVGGAGDVNGDGRSDVVVGIPGAAGNLGGVQLVRDYQAAAAMITPPFRVANSRWGQREVLVLDLQGDGLADLFSRGDMTTAAWLPGSRTGTQTASLIAGNSLINVFDIVGTFDATAGDEILVMTTGNQLATFSLGPTRTPVFTPFATFTSATALVSATGDFDGDGFSDFLFVAAPAMGGALQFVRGGAVPQVLTATSPPMTGHLALGRRN
ncbi:MAG: VCBS repeat-containing protein [Deltaproteobacteria bacterium]|nr:VCBS repeat-containing protein [Deltaproteobacteria bacterium]